MASPVSPGNISRFSSKIFSQNSQSSLPVIIKEFRSILTASGVILTSSSEENHIIKQEQALVVKKLTNTFENSAAKDTIENVLCALKCMCKKEKHFKKFLLCTVFQKTWEDDLVVFQDSLISIFLKIPQLQNEIIKILLDNITAVAISEDDNNDFINDTSGLRTLLKPLCCLSTIRDGFLLAKRLIDLLDISTFAAQLEILEAIPEIIPDNQCDYTGKELIRLLNDKDELCGAIVDCLTALNLEYRIRIEIHEKILSKILSGVSVKVYIILIKFLLSDFKSQNLPTTLLKIRSSLDNIMGSSDHHSKEKESDKTMIFNYLQTSAVTQKPLAEGWLNTISNCKNSADHKPIDILIILTLYHTSETRRKTIQTIFKKHVSLGFFKENLVNKVFEDYFTPQLLKDYITDIMEIGCYFLKFAKNKNVAKFASNMLQCLFYHDYTGSIYRAELLANLLTLSSLNDEYTINSVLKLIFSLVKRNKPLIRTHAGILMQLLEKLDTFNYKNVKLVFEILCLLLCGADQSLSGFKDEIFNTTRKQLSCSERSIKYRGIISAIIIVKYTALLESKVVDVEIAALEESTTEISNLPEGSPKEAAKLLELIECASGDNPDLLCLYYDQLASILAESDQGFNKYFLYWLYKKVGKNFEKKFLDFNNAAVDSELNNNISLQYILNCPEETDPAFFINIAGYVFGKNDKILLLSPYFRVLRLLHIKQNGNLSAIDSLIGCGVMLPAANNSKDIDKIQNIADCLFHCINWFRELINAFVGQKEPLIQNRVVQRLDNLISLENKLQTVLEDLPSPNLPLTYFDSLQRITNQASIKESLLKTTNPKKKIKLDSIVNETIMGSASNTQDINKYSSKKLCTSNSTTIILRKMDIEVIRLIKYRLNDNDENIDKSGQSISLNLNQINFILNDFIDNLAILTEEEKMIRSSRLSDTDPETLITACLKIAYNLNKLLSVLVEKMNFILEEQATNRYTKEVNNYKVCFGNILEIYYLTFQWRGFQQDRYNDLFRSILKGVTREGNSQSFPSASRLINEFIQKISKFSKYCLHLNQAVNLIKIINILNNSLTEPKIETKWKLSSMSEEFLGKKWYDLNGKLEQGPTSNNNIHIIITAYFKKLNSNSVCALVEIIESDLSALKPKDGCLTKFAAINKKNFHLFYLELYNSLVNSINSEISALTNTEQVSLWLTVASVMTKFMCIAKTLKNHRTISVTFLRKSDSLLKIFLSRGIPTMEIIMKSYSKQVCQIFQTIQTTTRFLLKLCCQAKLTRNSCILPYIPSFKQTEEAIIYRVKAALAANNCSSAFTLGNLKNRDINGEDIISQSTIPSTSSELGNSNHLPSDEEFEDEGDDQNIINYGNYENDSISESSEVYN